MDLVVAEVELSRCMKALEPLEVHRLEVEEGDIHQGDPAVLGLPELLSRPGGPEAQQVPWLPGVQENRSDLAARLGQEGRCCRLYRRVPVIPEVQEVRPLPCRQTCPGARELQEIPEVPAVPEPQKVPVHRPVRPCQTNLGHRAVRPSHYGRRSRGCRLYQELQGLLDLPEGRGYLEFRHDQGDLGDPGAREVRDTGLTGRISPLPPPRSTGDLR